MIAAGSATLPPALAARWAALTARVGATFDAAVRAHGTASAALDYGSWESQRVRFAAIASALPADARSVLDVGCGFGDLAGYLREQGRDEVAYVGLDISTAAVAVARERAPDARFVVGDIFESDWLPEGVTRFDAVVSNGVCYCWGADAWPLVEAYLRRLHALARRAVVFTALSTFAEHRSADDWYADPGALLNFGRTLSARVAVRCDYLPHDCLLLLQRDGEEAAA